MGSGKVPATCILVLMISIGAHTTLLSTPDMQPLVKLIKNC
jgi:hypothetical protein